MTSRVTVESEKGYRNVTDPSLWGRLGGALVLVAGGTLTATRLAAADMRPERATMLSVTTFWRISPTERFFDTSTTTDYITWSAQPRVTAPPSGKVAVTSGPPVLPETDDDIDVLAARPVTG